MKIMCGIIYSLKINDNEKITLLSKIFISKCFSLGGGWCGKILLFIFFFLRRDGEGSFFIIIISQIHA